MRVPKSLESLIDMGVVTDVVRPLLSGKEAEVFLVMSGGKHRVAKVYKDAQNRSFRQRSEYTEGRTVRNSRDQRAVGKRSKHGRAQDEAAWRSSEVDTIYKLQAAGVRVPVPYHFIDGVLIMELVADASGNPAPRIGELSFDAEQAMWIFNRLLGDVVRMLCAGVVHGDLSDFNVLMATDGPVIIDFPQSVDPASNQNARVLLGRDVDNLQRFLARFVPGWQMLPFAAEMWDLYARNLLAPDTMLTGRHRSSERRADTHDVLSLIGDADYDERKRREKVGRSTRGMGAAPSQPQPRVPEVTVARGLGARPASERSDVRTPGPGANPHGHTHPNTQAKPKPNTPHPQHGTHPPPPRRDHAAPPGHHRNDGNMPPRAPDPRTRRDGNGANSGGGHNGGAGGGGGHGAKTGGDGRGPNAGAPNEPPRRRFPR